MGVRVHWANPHQDLDWIEIALDRALCQCRQHWIDTQCSCNKAVPTELSTRMNLYHIFYLDWWRIVGPFKSLERHPDSKCPCRNNKEQAHVLVETVLTPWLCDRLSYSLGATKKVTRSTRHAEVGMYKSVHCCLSATHLCIQYLLLGRVQIEICMGIQTVSCANMWLASLSNKPQEI